MVRIISENEHIIIYGDERPSETLAVTFAPLFFADKAEGYWAAEPIEKSAFSGMGVVCKTPTWYPASYALEAIREAAPFWRKFRRRFTYGFSMGGYGALRFSRDVGANAAIAVSPQLTIDPSALPQDTRFSPNFTPSLHAGMTVRAHHLPKRSIIIYDPFQAEDAANAEMVPAFRVPLRYMGHDTIMALASSETFYLMTRAVLDGRETRLPAILKHQRKNNFRRALGIASRCFDRRPALADQIAASVSPAMNDWWQQWWQEERSRHVGNDIPSVG